MAWKQKIKGLLSKDEPFGADSVTDLTKSPHMRKGSRSSPRRDVVDLADTQHAQSTPILIESSLMDDACSPQPPSPNVGQEAGDRASLRSSAPMGALKRKRSASSGQTSAKTKRKPSLSTSPSAAVPVLSGNPKPFVREARDDASPLSDGDMKELLEILDDSPSFRDKLRMLETEVDTRSAKLRKIVKAAKEYQKAGQAYRDATASFSGELLSFPDACSEAQPLDPQLLSALQTIGQALTDVNDYHSMMFVQLGNVFMHPLDNFLKDNLKGAKDEARLHTKAQQHYDSVFSKMMHVKKGDAEKIQDLEPELLMARQLYQVSSIDLVSRLHEAKIQTEIELFERTAAFLYAQKAYFGQGNSLCQSMESTLGDVSQTIQQKRASLEADSDRLMKQKRQQAQFAASGKAHENVNKQTNISGYLFQLRKGKGWKKRFVEVRDGMIYGYKTGKESAPVPLSNLLLCTVKQASDIDRRYCFEIVSPTESYLLQAETAEEMMKWMLVIQNATAHALNAQTGGRGDDGSAVPLSDKVSSGQKHLAMEIAYVDESNRVCADCGTAEPDWASINLGITICIQCSGIHRNLGTHVTKVRSLTLDVWAPETLKVVKALGNAKTNSFLEANIPNGVKRPTPQSGRAEREEWIKEKYVNQTYAAPRPSIPDDEWEEQFLRAVTYSDWIGVLSYIRHGGKLDITSQDAEKHTALHLATMQNSPGLCELLLQNNADPNVTDGQGLAPLHHCALAELTACAIVLIKHGAKLDIQNPQGQIPLDIAVRTESAHCVTLLRLASHAQDEHPGNALKHESFQQALQMFSTDLEDLLQPAEPKQFWTADTQLSDSD